VRGWAFNPIAPLKRNHPKTELGEKEVNMIYFTLTESMPLVAILVVVTLIIVGMVNHRLEDMRLKQKHRKLAKWESKLIFRERRIKDRF
jgi:hypothetical protein